VETSLMAPKQKEDPQMMTVVIGGWLLLNVVFACAMYRRGRNKKKTSNVISLAQEVRYRKMMAPGG
jgi:hypothetical protein